MRQRHRLHLHHFCDELLGECLKQNKRLVIGTTGHTNAQLDAIREASKTLPIVFASNYSVGVNTLFWLTRKACELLGPDFDLEVVEMHHRMKKTLPAAPPARWSRRSWMCVA